MTVRNVYGANSRRAYRLCFSGSVSLLALIAMSSTGTAQETDIEQIVVNGQKLATQRSIEVKRAATTIIDSVSADDIGRLPDLNTASALRRVPGVSVQTDQGEPRFPVMRGLNNTYNRTTIDGALIASPERGNRTVPLDVVPASLLSRVEAIKTVTPDMDPNAIGGTINLVTRSAFDTEEPMFLTGSAFYGLPEQIGKGGTLSSGRRDQPWRINFAGGGRFGPAQQFGVVVGFDYSVRNFEIPQIEVDDADYTEFTSAGVNVLDLGETPFSAGSSGNGIVVPTNQRIFWYNNVRERIGGNVNLEWRPNAEFTLEVGGLYSDFNDDERRDENIYELGSSGGRNQPDTITGQTPTSGFSEDGFSAVGLGRFVIDRSLWSTRANMDWQVSNDLLWELDVIYSGAKLDNPESTESFRTAVSTDYGAFYDTSGLFNRILPANPQAFFDVANYTHGNRGELQRGLNEDQYEVKTGATFDLDLSGRQIEATLGGLYRDFSKSEFTRFQSYVVDPASGLSYTLADAVDRELADETFQGGYRMSFRVDSDGATNFFTTNRANFNQVTDFTSMSDANEKIWAGYAMAETAFGPLTVTGGFRIEHTDWDGADLVAGTSVKGSYTNYLPGLLLRYDVREDLVARAAYTETIGRPDTSLLTRGQTISVGPTGDLTVSRSNPNLKPRKSRNVDLSLEWYIPDGIVSVGAFYKDVSNEIFTQTVNDVQVDLGNGPVAVSTLTQPVNAVSAEILGLELQAQQTFTWLPAPFDNFGVSGNLTVLDTTFRIPTATGSRTTGFFQQPDTTANVALYYTTEFFEIRGSWNYTGSYLDTVVADDPIRDEYWRSRQTVDAQARVNLTEQFTIIAEAQNLTNSTRTEVTGPNHQFLQEHAQFGRTFWLGASFTY